MLLLANYADVLEYLPDYDHTIGDMIEERYGVRTARIEQTVEPCAFIAAQARTLGVQSGSLGLRFQRTYLDRRGKVFEHALSLQAGDEARLSMMIRASASR